MFESLLWRTAHLGAISSVSQDRVGGCAVGFATPWTSKLKSRLGQKSNDQACELESVWLVVVWKSYFLTSDVEGTTPLEPVASTIGGVVGQSFINWSQKSHLNVDSHGHPRRMLE